MMKNLNNNLIIQGFNDHEKVKIKSYFLFLFWHLGMFLRFKKAFLKVHLPHQIDCPQ